MTSPLLLLDSAAMYFRAFYGVPESVRAPDGTPVNAVRGLLDAITRLVLVRRPTRLVACWDDDWRPAWRVAAIPSYKAHRVEGGVDERGVPLVGAGPPTRSGAVGGGRLPTGADAVGGGGAEEVTPALAVQVPIIVDVLAALGIARVGAPGFEADDVIGTLTTRELARPPAERSAVEIVTGDRDLFQLVDDAAGVRVLYPARGSTEPAVVDQAWLAERYAVADGAAYADMSVLRGDPSDGLPGVPGIGEKTAALLIGRYGSLTGLLAALAAGDPGLPASQVRRLTEAADYLAVAPRVVRVARDVPLGEVVDVLPTTPVDPSALDALATRWGLTSSIARLTDALAVSSSR